MLRKINNNRSILKSSDKCALIDGNGVNNQQNFNNFNKKFLKSNRRISMWIQKKYSIILLISLQLKAFILESTTGPMQCFAKLLLDINIHSRYIMNQQQEFYVTRCIIEGLIYKINDMIKNEFKVNMQSQKNKQIINV